jgi:hypothetical protein
MLKLDQMFPAGKNVLSDFALRYLSRMLSLRTKNTFVNFKYNIQTNLQIDKSTNQQKVKQIF